jgi:hypothetical protein
VTLRSEQHSLVAFVKHVDATLQVPLQAVVMLAAHLAGVKQVRVPLQVGFCSK